VPDLFAVNTIGGPDQVVLSEPQRLTVTDGLITLPAHSITLLTFTL
jgi:hypothetical protein